jgi:hypothetical protein
MHPDAPYFSIFFCLTPDDFIRQVESAATQLVNLQGVSYSQKFRVKHGFPITLR